MRIAIASDDEATVAAHVGRCRGFVIFEVAEGRAVRREYRENRFTGHARGACVQDAEHGHVGHHPHGPLLGALGDCCALITRGIGPRLVADLAAQGIDAHVCGVADVEAAAEQFAAGRLPRLEGRSCPDRHAE